MSDFRDYLNEQLQNPEVRREYDALEAEYSIKQAMLCVETACEIGINACIDILGREFVIAHRESGTAAFGVCEDGVFCFIGVETDAPSRNTDNTLVLDSSSVFTHQVSCFVCFKDGEIIFR